MRCLDGFNTPFATCSKPQRTFKHAFILRKYTLNVAKIGQVFTEHLLTIIGLCLLATLGN